MVTLVFQRRDACASVSCSPGISRYSLCTRFDRSTTVLRPFTIPSVIGMTPSLRMRRIGAGKHVRHVASFRLRQSEFFDAIAHLIAINPQEMSGMRLVAAGAFECLDHELPLHLVEVHALRRQPERRCNRAAR